MLDTLRPTATGIDQVPAWFLRLGAPVFAAPLARLFHQSLASGVVPRQWKTVTPIPNEFSAPERLPVNIDHPGPVAVVRAVCRPDVYLLSSVSTVPVARLQRPVRVQADRLASSLSHGWLWSYTSVCLYEQDVLVKETV